MVSGGQETVAATATLVQLAVAEGEDGSGWHRRWNAEEEEFLRDSLGVLSMETIAAVLGRTVTGVTLRRKRAGMPAPSKLPGHLTALQTAYTMGVDVPAVCRWIDERWLPGRQLPFSGRRMWQVSMADLRRFAIRPEHWVLFRAERIGHRRLRRLVELAQERWGDEWLTPGEVAAIHGNGVTHSDVNRYIHAGKLQGVKWGNWWIRRSDALSVSFAKGKGSGHALDWSPDGDGFIVLGRAVGLSFTAIGRMRAGRRRELAEDAAKQAGARVKGLWQSGQLEHLIEKYELDVDVAEEGKVLWTDWHGHRGRLPGVARAMDKFNAGRRLSFVEWDTVRGVLRCWAARFLGRKDPLTRSLSVRGRGGRKARFDRLTRGYDELVQRGVDPLRERISCRYE